MVDVRQGNGWVLEVFSREMRKVGFSYFPVYFCLGLLLKRFSLLFLQNKSYFSNSILTIPYEY